VSSPCHSRVDAPVHNQQLEEEEKAVREQCCEIVESSTVMVCSCHDFFSGHCLLNDGDISGLAIANSAASRPATIIFSKPTVRKHYLVTTGHLYAEIAPSG